MSYEDYIGIPYKEISSSRSGVDCFGFPQLFYRDRGIDLPFVHSLEFEQSPEDLVPRYASKTKEWNKVLIPQPEDFLFFKIKSKTHCGVYIGNDRFLHVTKRVGVVNGRFSLWKRSLYKIYRRVG